MEFLYVFARFTLDITLRMYLTEKSAFLVLDRSDASKETFVSIINQSIFDECICGPIDVYKYRSKRFFALIGRYQRSADWSIRRIISVSDKTSRPQFTPRDTSGASYRLRHPHKLPSTDQRSARDARLIYTGSWCVWYRWMNPVAQTGNFIVR